MACVLIVDGDDLFTRSLQILLEDEGGHEVSVAHSVPDALGVLERDHTVELVVSDLAVPDGGHCLVEVGAFWVVAQVALLQPPQQP